MQRVVRQIVVMDVAPDFFRSPIGQRIDLDQMKLRVPLHLERSGSGRGLITTDAGYPGAQSREFALQRLDLSEIAAGIRIAGPERRSVESLLILRV